MVHDIYLEYGMLERNMSDLIKCVVKVCLIIKEIIDKWMMIILYLSLQLFLFT